MSQSTQNLKKVSKSSNSASERKRWYPDWRTVVSAILIVLAFPPWHLWPLLWICLVPWFAAIKRARTPLEASIQGVWLGYFMSLGGFYWVAFVLQEFGNVPWIVAILGLQVFCLFGQPQFFTFAPLYKALQKPEAERVASAKSWAWKAAILPFFIALTYTGLDWVLPKIFLDTLGHAFYLARHFRQVADLGGAALLTFLVFLMNDAIWNLFQMRKELKKHPRYALAPQVAVAVILCLSGWTYGYFRYREIVTLVKNAPRGIQAAAIQANIGDFDKIAAERGITGAAHKIIDTYISMTDQALKLDPQPDVVIWPETSFPSTFRKPHTRTEMLLDQQVNQYAQSLKIPLLFGGYDRVNRRDFNAFFFMAPNGTLQTYRKNILLLFGEYIPGADSFDFIKDAFPQVGNFGRGDGPDVLEIMSSNPKVGIVKAGPIICYEALFPNYIAEAARHGSQLIMNITNDSWFGEWGEPQLHLALTTFRSIESRLPMLRSTNTGISTLVLPDGEITNATEIGVPRIMNVHVPLTAPIPTLFKAWGDWFGIFSLLVGGTGLALRHSRKYRRR